MNRNLSQKIESHIFNIISSIVDILRCVVVIITLGFILPNWDFRLIAWYSKRKVKERIKSK